MPALAERLWPDYLPLESEGFLSVAATAHALGQPLEQIIAPPARNVANPFEAQRAFEGKKNWLRKEAKILRGKKKPIGWVLNKAPIGLSAFDFDTGKMRICVPSAVQALGKGLLVNHTKSLKFDFLGMGSRGCIGAIVGRWQERPKNAVFHNHSIGLNLSDELAEQLYLARQNGGVFATTFCANPYLQEPVRSSHKEFFCEVIHIDIIDGDEQKFFELAYSPRTNQWVLTRP